MRVERVNFPQDAVSRKESNVEGEMGVAHPKRHLLGSIENEKHTLVLRHRLSKHEPFGLSGLIYNENAQVLNRPITYQDAIDALRMSVGLETVKAEAEGRITSELEYIASDMTGDGYLNYVDAIQMLMASVGLGLDTPEGPSFKMIDSAFSDATIDEKNIYSPHITSLLNVVDDTSLNLNILLTGDITGIA